MSYCGGCGSALKYCQCEVCPKCDAFINRCSCNDNLPADPFEAISDDGPMYSDWDTEDQEEHDAAREIVNRIS